MARRAKVACLLGDGFEDSEFRIPYDRLKGEGYEVDVVGAEAGQELHGERNRETVRTTRGIDEARPEDYQALFIPGGYSPDHLRIDPRIVEFVKRFDATRRPVAAVCHGPQLLMAAHLVKGRTLTAWPTVQDDLRLAGAQVRDEAVVRDQNWITSRKPDDLDQFSRAVIEALHSSGAGTGAGARA